MAICTIHKIAMVAVTMAVAFCGTAHTVWGGNAIGGTTRAEDNRPLIGVKVSVEGDLVTSKSEEPDGVYTMNVPETYTRVTLIFEKAGFLNAFDPDIDNTLSQQTRSPVVLCAVAGVNSLDSKQLQKIFKDNIFAFDYGQKHRLKNLVQAAHRNLTLLVQYVQPDSEEKRLLIRQAKDALETA